MVTKVYHSPLLFNNSTVQPHQLKSIWGYILMKSLHSNILMKRKLKPIRVLELFVNWITFFLAPFSNNLPFFCKTRSRLWWLIFDQPENESFSSKIERVQYNASLTITGAIRGTSQEKLYQELGLESLRSRKKMVKAMVLFLQVNYNSNAIIPFQSNTSET